MDGGCGYGYGYGYSGYNPYGYNGMYGLKSCLKPCNRFDSPFYNSSYYPGGIIDSGCAYGNQGIYGYGRNGIYNPYGLTGGLRYDLDSCGPYSRFGYGRYGSGGYGGYGGYGSYDYGGYPYNSCMSFYGPYPPYANDMYMYRCDVAKQNHNNAVEFSELKSIAYNPENVCKCKGCEILGPNYCEKLFFSQVSCLTYPWLYKLPNWLTKSKSEKSSSKLAVDCDTMSSASKKKLK